MAKGKSAANGKGKGVMGSFVPSPASYTLEKWRKGEREEQCSADLEKPLAVQRQTEREKRNPVGRRRSTLRGEAESTPFGKGECTPLVVKREAHSPPSEDDAHSPSKHPPLSLSLRVTVRERRTLSALLLENEERKNRVLFHAERRARFFRGTQCLFEGRRGIFERTQRRGLGFERSRGGAQEEEGGRGVLGLRHSISFRGGVEERGLRTKEKKGGAVGREDDD
ncbi:hypothetical protein CYLTODRAFT_413450 [Cylindrobasidium torrendii FP15055 ss-10]|uniref:Uncharacterized protein n=1 Tax=Cylindrobasidium torrendii FP15055 ss-10 TaxID=1314674 RepID=A0A0D7B242_9AGAR|nr:hypothetical protein CYLTODRAFT_413450 [Cylindrobasidium torrendii FP15055 ss-10]